MMKDYFIRWMLLLSAIFTAHRISAIDAVDCGDPSSVLLKLARKLTWPWMASVGVDMNFVDKRRGTWRAGNCDAVLINAEWAITSAECLRDVVIKYDRNPNKKRWTVRSGMHERVFKGRTREHFRKSRAIFNVHSQGASPRAPPVALVQMKTKIGYGPGIKPVCLPFKNEAKDVVCNVIGYGTVKVRFSDLASHRVIPNNCSFCKSKYRNFNCLKEICTEFENDIFKGVAGGILVCQAKNADLYTWYVAGIGRFEAAGSRFTRVEPLLPWINNAIITHSRNREKKRIKKKIFL